MTVLALADNDIQRGVTDTDGQRQLHPSASALIHQHMACATRHANASMCSRAVSLLHGLAGRFGLRRGGVFRVYKEYEDRRVVLGSRLQSRKPVVPSTDAVSGTRRRHAASRAPSPVHPAGELRLSTFWALKNLIYRCAPETQRAIVSDVG